MTVLQRLVTNDERLQRRQVGGGEGGQRGQRMTAERQIGQRWNIYAQYGQ